MSNFIFSLDVDKNQLALLQRKNLADLQMSEPKHLEAWLASSGSALFNRRILWLARQDRPSDDQRSDLIGADNQGNLLIAELKRGMVGDDAITQALAYAAEYARMSAEDLAAMYAEQSEKSGATSLVERAKSVEDAISKLSNHIGKNKLNESQILILVGEDFTSKVLSVCDYLNGSSGEASFSIECWRYNIFIAEQERHYFVLEQVLPPPSIRQSIDEKREASKDKKYLRNPVKVKFVLDTIKFLSEKYVETRRNSGASYEFWIVDDVFRYDCELCFSVHNANPRLILTDGLRFGGDLSQFNLKEGANWNGRRTLEFSDVDMGGATFSQEFGARLIDVINLIKPGVRGEQEG